MEKQIYIERKIKRFYRLNYNTRMSCVKLNSRWFFSFFLLYNFIYICIKGLEANKMQMKWHGSVFIIHQAGYSEHIEIIILYM